MNRKLIPFIQSFVNNDSVYWEPFCGGCSIMIGIKAKTRIASDSHHDLILLWKALQEGFVPPVIVDEEQYRKLRLGPPSALRGFVGFAGSFAGKWFGGYAREKGYRNYFLAGKQSLGRKLPLLSGVHFVRTDYKSADIRADVIYCDPPYQGMTGYKGTEPFNHEKFWNWVREQSLKSIVLVSSYEAPSDFKIVWAIQAKLSVHTTKVGKNCVERVFRFEGDQK